MTGSKDKSSRKIAICMGSQSDWKTMQEAAAILEQFDAPHEVKIISAHRTPNRLTNFAQTAHDEGFDVIIAGAGGAAHLPGMLAAHTHLPVLGVPIESAALKGMDSLLSIVQMPKGVPVATVAIHNAANAGLLAVRMLGMADAGLRTKMAAFMKEQETEVLGKAAKLEEIGYEGYK